MRDTGRLDMVVHLCRFDGEHMFLEQYVEGESRPNISFSFQISSLWKFAWKTKSFHAPSN